MSDARRARLGERCNLVRTAGQSTLLVQAVDVLDILAASKQDREALGLLRPGECPECKGSGEDWSNAAPTPCEGCRGSTCGVVAELSGQVDAMRVQREDDRETLAEARKLLEQMDEKRFSSEHWERLDAFLKRTELT